MHSKARLIEKMSPAKTVGLEERTKACILPHPTLPRVLDAEQAPGSIKTSLPMPHKQNTSKPPREDVGWNRLLTYLEILK